MSDAVTVPCLIDVTKRSVSSQWVRMRLALIVPPMRTLMAG
jgi:hypothetical protein